MPETTTTTPPAPPAAPPAATAADPRASERRERVADARRRIAGYAVARREPGETQAELADRVAADAVAEARQIVREFGGELADTAVECTPSATEISAARERRIERAKAQRLQANADRAEREKRARDERTENAPPRKRR